MTDLAKLVRALADARVEFILVGGLAANAHGSARVTTDVDVVYSRTPRDRTIRQRLLTAAPTPQ